MKKYIIWTIIILVVLALLNPLWWPMNYLRAYVLLRVPLGTSITKAEEKIYYWTSWEIDRIEDSGYENPSDDGETVVGVKSIRVHLGQYKIPLVTCDVLAFLGFDENGKLIDVAIKKEYDSL